MPETQSSSRYDDATMQSEIFIVLMALVAFLFVAAAINMRIASDSWKEADEKRKKAEADKKASMDAWIEVDQKWKEAKDIINKIRSKEQPPLITLDEAEGYTFETGLAILSEHFQSDLNNSIIPEIERRAKEYICDIIEVYGYTDGQPYPKGVASQNNMDENLLTGIETTQIENLKAASNLELGMLRAASIVIFLKKSQDVGRLPGIKMIRPYSGGQLILPTGEIALSNVTENDPRRRRIEIRLSRSRDLHKN